MPPCAHLKRSLPKKGMSWGLPRHVRVKNCGDAKVVKALKALGVRARATEVQPFLAQLFDDAVKFVNRHQLPDNMTIAGFCEVFGRTNRLANKLSKEIFADFIKVLINGRVRFIQRGEESGWDYRFPREDCPLAVAIDGFIAAAPCVNWDAVKHQVSSAVESVAEVRVDEHNNASVTIVSGANEDDGADGLLALAEAVDMITVGGEEGDEDAEADEVEADDDAAEGMNLDD